MKYNKYPKEIREYCIREYPKYIGRKKKFCEDINIKFKTNYDIQTLISYIKGIGLLKAKYVDGFYLIHYPVIKEPNLPKGIFALNKDKIIKWYIEDRISGCEITERLKTKNKRIYEFLRSCNVKVRTRSESHVGIKLSQESLDKIKRTKDIRGSHIVPNSRRGERSIANKGKTYEEIYGKEKSDKIKKKQSLARNGKKGWRPTPQQRIAHSIRMSGKGSGNKNYFWKGGVNKSGYPKEFNGLLKLRIRTRDNFTCQECYKTNLDYKLHIHHIDFNKNNCHPDNLIGLCRECHGKTQYKKIDWIEYYQNKMEKRKLQK